MTIFRFPPQLREVKLPGDTPEQSAAFEPALVDHGGHPYRLVEMLACLFAAKLAEINATMPRTGPAAWDEVVRRWPGLVWEIVAGA